VQGKPVRLRRFWATVATVLAALTTAPSMRPWLLCFFVGLLSGQDLVDELNRHSIDPSPTAEATRLTLKPHSFVRMAAQPTMIKLLRHRVKSLASNSSICTRLPELWEHREQACLFHRLSRRQFRYTPPCYAKARGRGLSSTA
jgi:hypothetical protein